MGSADTQSVPKLAGLRIETTVYAPCGVVGSTTYTGDASGFWALVTTLALAAFAAARPL